MQNCLAPHLADKHKMYQVQKYVTPYTFIGIGFLLNYIRLTLLQPFQD